MSSYTVIAATAGEMGSAQALAALELAHACGADLSWVTELVALGIVEAHDASASPYEWRFHSADLQCALEARRLEHDFGVSLDAAALILDLQHEVRRLKAILRRQGLVQV